MLLRHAKSMVKATVSPLLDVAGVYDRRIDQLAAQHNSWTIVMYHRVVADASADPFGLGMCVRRERFEAQVRYLRRHFNVIPLREGVACVERGDPLPERAVSITFDDGYLDNLEIALPILEACDAPATLFVPTGGLDTDEMLWWDRVIAALAGTSKESLDTGTVGLPHRPQVLSLSRWRRAASAEAVLEQLWTLPIEQAIEVVHRIEKALLPIVKPVVRAERLRAQQIREMHRRGVEIGAHSVRHPNLMLVPQSELEREMTASRDVLEELCQAPIEGFAYPGGRMNDASVHAARDAGFRYAVATISAVNHAPCDRFRLCRIGMPDSTVADFKRALSMKMRRADGVLHAPA